MLKWANEGHKRVRVGLFCEDFPALKDRHVQRISQEFPRWLGTLSDNNIQGLSFVLKPEFGGGILALRNLDDPSKYASSEFAAVAVDELTKNKQEVFDQLRSVMRWPGIDETKFIAGTNPGGIGHQWVKKIWVDKEFESTEPEPEQFHFIQAFAKDNPHLSENYIRSLGGLPENLRKAYLDGEWNLFEGQYFNEWREDKHVVEPFSIPDTWKRIRTIDHGRTAPTACLWGAIDHDGKIYWYREYYKANEDADINAQKISRMSADERYAFTVLDSSCFSKTGTGETLAEIYERNGVSDVQPWPKNRLAGWALFHEFLREKMVFFSTCDNATKTIPSLIHDKNHPEDLDSNGEDHAADAVRGALEFLHESKTPKPKDPLEIMLDKWKKKHSVSPSRLNDFYARR